MASALAAVPPVVIRSTQAEIGLPRTSIRW